jgi:hypothetical protein
LRFGTLLGAQLLGLLAGSGSGEGACVVLAPDEELALLGWLAGILAA